ncbi:MAG: hypothetical protein AB1671_11925 [Thermodesulfobacteriota bacterium]|jgi:hypothetical protein
MTFVLYLAGLLFISVIALVVALPFFRPREGAGLPATTQEDPRTRWEQQKADAYAAIKEAEFDRQMGKLTDEDYRLLRGRYEARALEALAQLDRLARSQPKREGGAASSNEASG